MMHIGLLALCFMFFFFPFFFFFKFEQFEGEWKRIRTAAVRFQNITCIERKFTGKIFQEKVKNSDLRHFLLHSLEEQNIPLHWIV